jgi:hypothetical protein
MVTGYNERLFKGRFRGWFHLARFRWIKKICSIHSPDMKCVVELGCFDARTLDWIPTPIKFYGYDAGWEGGLLAARKRFIGCKEFHFLQCDSPDTFMDIKEKVTLFISLETLEHIPAYMLYGYVEKISIANPDYVLITVPNEKGAIFFIKYIFKYFIGSAEKYTWREFLAATFCRMDYVTRNEHKGFDWEIIREIFKNHFILVGVEGVQFPLLPLWANLQIGMVFKAGQPI